MVFRAEHRCLDALQGVVPSELWTVPKISIRYSSDRIAEFDEANLFVTEK